MFHDLTLALLALAVGAALYYLGLALVALLPRPAQRLPSGPPVHSFAILIPAHNEAEVIAATLRCCAELDYPADRYQIFVIADNCSDDTAALAQAAGAVCLERRDLLRRGKGEALGWAFPQVLAYGHDAILVLDADCRIDRQALRVFDQHLRTGERVLQARVLVSAADASAIGYAVAVGSVLENDLFYRAKDRLGLAVLLRGTGMVFARSVLDEHPWHAHTTVEDAQYTLRLLRAGLTVRFVSEVSVHSDAPTDIDQLRVQRSRWTAGTFRFGKRRALRLILEGLWHGRGRLIDAGWTLLVQIKPLVLLEWLATVACAAAACLIEPGPGSNLLLALSGAVGLAYVVYAGLGVAALGVSRRRLGLLMRLPFVVAGMVGIFLHGVFGKDTWVATRRIRVQP